MQNEPTLLECFEAAIEGRQIMAKKKEQPAPEAIAKEVYAEIDRGDRFWVAYNSALSGLCRNSPKWGNYQDLVEAAAAIAEKSVEEFERRHGK